MPKLAFHNRNDNEILHKEFSSAGPRTFVFFWQKLLAFQLFSFYTRRLPTNFQTLASFYYFANEHVSNE